MRVLLVGSGGREHALAWGLSRSPLLTELHAAPGNPGIGALATLHDVPVSDLEQITELAGRLAADLVVVGPEAPLVAGLGDRLADAGIACFGPGGAAAQIEGSKLFAKSVMDAAGVPTAGFSVCDTPAAAPLRSRRPRAMWWSRRTAWPAVRACSCARPWPRPRRPCGRA